MTSFLFQDSSCGTEEQNGEILWQLSSSLLPIAKRHEGYQTLWSLCCDLNDLDLLRSLMVCKQITLFFLISSSSFLPSVCFSVFGLLFIFLSIYALSLNHRYMYLCSFSSSSHYSYLGITQHESMGPKGGFCNFVFKQMYDNKHYSKLIRLGEEFQEELANFLKQHPHLCWLHELFLNQFHFASESLHTLAFSEEEGLALATGKLDSCCTVKSLADRKRFLNLSKIAAFAGIYAFAAPAPNSCFLDVFSCTINVSHCILAVLQARIQSMG